MGHHKSQTTNLNNEHNYPNFICHFPGDDQIEAFGCNGAAGKIRDLCQNDCTWYQVFLSYQNDMITKSQNNGQYMDFSPNDAYNQAMNSRDPCFLSFPVTYMNFKETRTYLINQLVREHQKAGGRKSQISFGDPSFATDWWDLGYCQL